MWLEKLPASFSFGGWTFSLETRILEVVAWLLGCSMRSLDDPSIRDNISWSIVNGGMTSER
ncbi:hypothetical protein AKJ16_DCAP05239 [Drosera capensis]